MFVLSLSIIYLFHFVFSFIALTDLTPCSQSQQMFISATQNSPGTETT